MPNHPNRAKKEPTEIMGWWFAASDVLPHGDGRKIILGEKLTVEPPIICCRRGLHYSVHPFDALQYAPGPMLYKVLPTGIIKSESDKGAASERTAVDVRDATQMLWAFARKMALSVIHRWDAPEIVREYLETGDETKRAAAWDAARAAERAAAWDAARAAAWDAARAAERAAAWAAAWDAARAAERDAAWDAARDAAWAAERDAERDAAKQTFLEMVTDLFSE